MRLPTHYLSRLFSNETYRGIRDAASSAVLDEIWPEDADFTFQFGPATSSAFGPDRWRQWATSALQ